MGTNRCVERSCGCIDCFAYGGYDVRLQKFTSPDSEDRKFHRKKWYLYQRGKYVGKSFKTDKEAMAWIDSTETA